MDSILNSIKKLLGVEVDYNQFDTDIVMHINSVFMELTQLGVGPSEGFSIGGDGSEEWNEFVDDGKYEAVRSYMYLKVKLLFDPPLSSAVIDAMRRQIDNLEWRINMAAELSTDVEHNREEEI